MSSSIPSTTTVTLPPMTNRGDLPADTEVDVIRLDGRPLTVAVAATPDARNQGLRGVTDLGELDGMLFRWDTAAVTAVFTMADTLIPLDVAFFASDGAFVDGFRMEPCEAAPCPAYSARAPYAFALESPAASLPPPGPGSVLDVGS
jgi:uncharacterized protein